MKSVRVLLNFGAAPRSTNILLKQKCRPFSSSREITETKVKVGDRYINYVKSGSGPHTVLCLPGALGTAWTDFKPQIEGFNRDAFTLIVWDPPGYGKSRPPAREFPLDFFEKDAEAAEMLMTTLAYQKFSVLGWSDGGITGMIMAAKYPKSIEKLVFWGANSHILPSEGKIIQNIRDISKWSEKMKAPMIKEYGEETFKKLWEDWVDGYANIYNKKKGNICLESVQKIKCPVFMLHGTKDAMVHKDHIPFLHTNINSAILYEYPDGKHNIHIKYAEDFNKRVSKFLLA